MVGTTSASGGAVPAPTGPRTTATSVAVAASATTSDPMRRPTGTATTLGAGNFTGGIDVAPGLYDVTPGAAESGRFIVQGIDGYDEILGGAGVPRVRVQISDGDSIGISGLYQVIFTPVSPPYVTAHAPVTLYAGTWTVGQDLGPGAYVVTPGAGQSGELIVDAEHVDQVLGGSRGLSSVAVDLQRGDVVTISRLGQVAMTPVG